MHKARMCPATAAASLMIAMQPPPVAAQQRPTFEELKQSTDKLVAFADAQEHMPALCRGYVGKVVQPAAFDTLSRGLAAEPKGEFETTAQYKARRAAGPRSTGGWAVLSLPTDRGYLRYDADAGAMRVEAGAFGAGSFSDEDAAELNASLAAKDEGNARGTPIRYNTTERPLRSYVGQNEFGVKVRVTEVARHTRGLYAGTPTLFGGAISRDSPVMSFAVPVAQARAAKATMRVALVLKPRPPYLIDQTLDRLPVRGSVDYLDSASVLHVTTACALALDGGNRVLAATGAGGGAANVE